MNKRARSYRLHPTALEHLNVLQTLTGSTQASLIEQALAVYRSFLEEGSRVAGEMACRDSIPVRVKTKESVANESVEQPEVKDVSVVKKKKVVVARAQDGFGPLFDA